MTSLREYAGVYQWGPNAFLYLQMWQELVGANHLFAFDESGQLRVLYLRFIRPLIAYDPAPTLRQIKLPVLALFGELDNNIMAEKNRAAWDRALNAGGHPDYTLRILPKANHGMLEAKVGNNAEMKSLQRFVPA